ncbi:T9SS type A sorting domain-containing protein [Bacteroidota bacterium]
MYRKITGMSSIQIDLAQYNTGIYFITIRSENYVWTEKILKL